MDHSKTNKDLPKIIKEEKPEKPWKFGLSRDGKKALQIPSHMRIKPSKYSPSKGKKLKNTPHCFNMGPVSASCKACLWGTVCQGQHSAFVPEFQDAGNH